MVVYFEAERQRQITGAWSMPQWAPLVVWLSFSVAFLWDRLSSVSLSTDPAPTL